MCWIIMKWKRHKRILNWRKKRRTYLYQCFSGFGVKDRNSVVAIIGQRHRRRWACCHDECSFFYLFTTVFVSRFVSMGPFCFNQSIRYSTLVRKGFTSRDVPWWWLSSQQEKILSLNSVTRHIVWKIAVNDEINDCKVCLCQWLIWAIQTSNN